MDISKALEIPGWMSEQELTFLAERASESQAIAEIGSWRGRSARAMADNTPGIVYCVDTWDDGAVGITGWWSTPADDAKRRHKDWLWSEFAANIDGHLNRTVLSFRMHSLEAAKQFAPYVKFDLIFIDGDHSEQAVRADITSWEPLLRQGGILAGHDYNHPLCGGVKPAVDALVPGFKLVDTIWYASL